MVGNVFVRCLGAFLIFKETNMHYRSPLSRHRPQRSMEHYTNTELADVHLICELEKGNARVAERLYRERYPQRDAPDHRTFPKSASQFV
ncbi:hypothetical protein TNCV_3376411 [Trichonephila clavipes]|nr:hypothetical protein TNCV_3376411 [Trichonephila clavipes]